MVRKTGQKKKYKIMEKLKLGTRVYYLETTSIPAFYDCSLCDGIGAITVLKDTRQLVMTCPTCKGEKEFSNSGSIKSTVNCDEKNIITAIRTLENSSGMSISYYLANEKTFPSYQVFENLEEAENNAKKNNKALTGYTT